MSNPFENIISSDLKNLYNQAIDSLLATNALTVPCSISYGSSNNKLCNNCIFDPISHRSLNKYNGFGPAAFAENSICPICQGYGSIDSAKTEIVYLAVIFDSKYWLNWNSKSINISDGMVQTICKIDLLPKLKNAQKMTIDTSISSYGNYTYSLAGDPIPCGFGQNRYIISMWSRS